MNKENVLELADFIGDLEDGTEPGCFSMHRYVHGCGTPSCIAGYAVMLHRGLRTTQSLIPAEEIYDFSNTPTYEAQRRIHREARQWLGLNKSMADKLFTPSNEEADCNCYSEDESNYITPDRAAECLYHLAEHGIVDWSVTSNPNCI